MSEPWEQLSQPPPKPSLAAKLSVAFLLLVFGGLGALYLVSSKSGAGARSATSVASPPVEPPVTGSLAPEAAAARLHEANALFKQGVEHYQAGQPDSARQLWEQALKLYQTIKGTEREQAVCHENIGVTLFKMDRHQAGITRWEQALKIYQTIKGTEREQAVCHENIGMALGKMERHKEEVARREQALSLYQRIRGSERNQAGCHVDIGVALGKMGDHKEEIAWLEKALQLYGEFPGAERDQAACCQRIGGALTQIDRLDAGIVRQEQALKIYQTIKGTELDQAACQVNISMALGKMGNHKEEIARLEEALKLYQGIQGTERHQAGICQLIGAALAMMHQYQAEIADYEQALKLYQTVNGEELEEAVCHRNIGVALREMGKYGAGFARLEQALQLFQQIKGTEQAQADCHMNVGVMDFRWNKYEEGMVRFEQAIRLYQMLRGTEREQATCCMNIGAILGVMGQYEAEMARYERALKLFQVTQSSKRDQEVCCMNMGLALSDMGQYGDAIAHQEQALELLRQIKGTDQDQAACHRNIASVLLDMGEYEKGILSSERALHLYQEIPDTEGDQVTCWRLLGGCRLGSGQHGEALAAFEHCGKGGWRLERFRARAYRGRHQPGDAEKAVVSLASACQEADYARWYRQGMENRTSAFSEPSIVFRDMVELLADLQRDGLSLQSLGLLQLPGLNSLNWSFDSKQPQAWLDVAFHYLERGKGRFLDNAMADKQAQLQPARAVEAAPVVYILPPNREVAEVAREMLERGNGRVLEDEMLDRQARLQSGRASETAPRIYVLPTYRKPMEMARELPSGTAVLEYSVGEKEAWLLLMTHAGITGHRLVADVAALPELRPRQQATLAQLLEAFKERPDKLGLEGWVRLARSRAEDLGKPERERHGLVNFTLEQAILERLGGIVLPQSAQAELKRQGIHHLLVVPDGPLHYLPLAMVRLKGATNSTYLIEQYAVSSVSALTTLEAIRKQKVEREQKRKGPGKELLAFANPDFGAGPVVKASDDMVTRVRSVRNDYYVSKGLKLTALPETEQEAIRVASLFGSPQEYKSPTADGPEGLVAVYVDRGASELQVKRLFGGLPANSTLSAQPSTRCRYLLFGTHGLADERNGMLSCLALAAPAADSEEDGFLQAQEVLSLRLDTDLVMLSACQTGLGQMHGGEGLVGLSASFFVAGAESVCASLWQVPSGPTTQLSTEFFRHLKEGKLDRAEALRQAQLTVLRHGRSLDGAPADYSSPFCWAAFVLMGEYNQEGR